MTDAETTGDPCDDYIVDDVSVISDTTHGTDDVTSPSVWAGLKGLMKSPGRITECLHSPSKKGDFSPIIPSQNRTENLSGDAEQDDSMSDVESIVSTSLLTDKGKLSRPRDTTPLTHSDDNNHRVQSLVLSKSDMSTQPLNQDRTENATYDNEQVHSFCVPTKPLEHSKREEQHQRKGPENNYTQILDEIFGSKGSQPKSRHSNLTPRTGCRYQHGNDKAELAENLGGEILTDTAGFKHPPSIHQIQESQMTSKDLLAYDNLVSWEKLSSNEHLVSELTQEELSLQQPPKSIVNEDDLSTHLELDLCTHQQPVSQLAQPDMTAHQHSVPHLTQEELSTQLLDFIVEFTQVSSTSSGMGPSGSCPERFLESLPEHQNISSRFEPLLTNESSEELLLPNPETSSKSVQVANVPNNGPEIGKRSQDKQLLGRSKNGKQKPTTFCPPVLNPKDGTREAGESVPLTPHSCDPAKMKSVPWSSSRSIQGLQTKKSDQSQFPTNVSSMDPHRQSSSGTVGDKRLTMSANEKETLVNLMSRYQAMEKALQNRPDKSRVLEISTEMKQIQATIAQLNEQHKTERGRLSVRVAVKGLSKSSRKELKKELQELGDRQKHLLQVVNRHKQINFRLKQVLAGMDTPGTGRNCSKHTHGEMKTFSTSRLAAEAVEAEVTNSSGRSPLSEDPPAPRIYKTDIVDRFHDINSAEHGSASFEASLKKNKAPKVSQGGQNSVSRTYGAMETQTCNVTDYGDRAKEYLDNDDDVITQFYRDDMEQTQKTDISDNILISKSNPTCVEDNSVITGINNELLAKADVCHAPCSQIKEIEACVKSVHSSGAVDRTASQVSGIEDSQQDLFSQGSSEQEVDRKMVEEIIATQALSHESDCPDSDSRHVGGRVSQGKEEWVWKEGGTDWRGLKKGEMEEDEMDRGVEGMTDSEFEGLVDRGVDRRIGNGVEGRMNSGVERMMDREIQGMDGGVQGRMDTQADRKTDRHADRRTDSKVGERIETESDRRVSEQIKQNDERIALHNDNNTAGQGGVSSNVKKDDKLDKKNGADVCETNWNSATSSGPVNMKRKAQDSAPGFEGRSKFETKKIKRGAAEQCIKSVKGDQAPCKPGIDQSRSDASNAEVMKRDTNHQKAQSSSHRNLEGDSNKSKIACDKKRGFVLSVKQTCNKKVDVTLIPNSLKSKDGSLNKLHEILPENRNDANDTITGQVVGPSLSSHGNSGTPSIADAEGSANIFMCPSKVRSVCSGQKEVTCLSPPEQETEKVEDVSLMSPPNPYPLKKITTTPPQKLQSEDFTVSAFQSRGSTAAMELERSTTERDASQKQSRKDIVLLQIEAPSGYIAVGRTEDFCENSQVKDVDDNRCLNKTNEILPQSRNGNNDITTGQVHGQILSNHDKSGILSTAEGITHNLMSTSTVRSVCSNQKIVTCLSPQGPGTKKVKNVSLMSPCHPHPLKNTTRPAQKLQSDNLPASTFLSPGSTVASSDVFPVSCRELVRRMAERDAREKQSRDNSVLLQKEAPGDYIAIPVGRVEDFCENIQVKDVDDVTTQTPIFVQPQVPTAPESVATSKMADLTTLVQKGVLTPGKDVLSVRAKGKVFRSSLSSEGHIIGSGGQMFRTPKSWCQAVSGAVTVKKLQSYNMVLYKGQPLSSFVVGESTESSSHKDLRTQRKSHGKPVGSSITRSLKTANKSTSVPRQSYGISSTTSSANKVRTKSLSYSLKKSLSNGLRASPMKTPSRHTEMPFPAPPNGISVAHRELVAKGNKEISASVPSVLMRVLNKCTIKLIDDAEIIHCPEIDSTFWMTNFKDIRLSDSLWDSVDCWD